MALLGSHLHLPPYHSIYPPNPRHLHRRHSHRNPPSLSFKSPPKQTRLTLRATENGSEASPINQTTASEVGKEIKKAMEENENEKIKGGVESGDFFSGVVEEIREIEWPEFGKVLGTTGVVLGVIAGSSLVLLTVNALLAELSDQLFAGKGVQDFFSG